MTTSSADAAAIHYLRRTYGARLARPSCLGREELPDSRLAILVRGELKHVLPWVRRRLLACVFVDRRSQFLGGAIDIGGSVCRQGDSSFSFGVLYAPPGARDTVLVLGWVPAQCAEVRLIRSDGAVSTAASRQGAFLFVQAPLSGIVSIEYVSYAAAIMSTWPLRIPTFLERDG